MGDQAVQYVMPGARYRLWLLEPDSGCVAAVPAVHAAWAAGELARWGVDCEAVAFPVAEARWLLTDRVAVAHCVDVLLWDLSPRLPDQCGIDSIEALWQLADYL